MIKDLTYPIPWVPEWEIVDGSKLGTGMECMRQFFYKYVLGWRSTAPNNHLIFGKAWHKAQEHLLLNGYNSTSVDEAMFLFLDEYRKEIEPDADELYAPKTPKAAEEALKLYINHYADDLRKWEVLYTEIAGTVPINQNDVMHFRMDSILKDRETGKYLSLDHKTGSRRGRTWTDKWALDPGLGVYSHVLHCLYPKEEVKGIKVRGTFFYKSQPTIERIFEDVPVEKSVGQMSVWLWNTTFWYNMIRWNFGELAKCSTSDPIMTAFPMNSKSCTFYFGCPYHDFCMAWDNPLQHCEEPPMGFKIEHWDPSKEESTHQMNLE